VRVAPEVVPTPTADDVSRHTGARGRMARVAERWRWTWLFVMLIAAFGGGLFVTLLIVDGNRRDAQRALCDLVRVYHVEYVEHPPVTETGREIARQTALFIQRHC
jgi:hypothetical protein